MIELEDKWKMYKAKFWLKAKGDGLLQVSIIAIIKNKKYRFDEDVERRDGPLSDQIPEAVERIWKQVIDIEEHFNDPLF